jgi:hypothetical protein
MLSSQSDAPKSAIREYCLFAQQIIDQAPSNWTEPPTFSEDPAAMRLHYRPPSDRTDFLSNLERLASNALAEARREGWDALDAERRTRELFGACRDLFFRIPLKYHVSGFDPTRVAETEAQLSSQLIHMAQQKCAEVLRMSLSEPTDGHAHVQHARELPRPRRTTVAEANHKAMDLAKKDRRFALLSEREQAKRIGCSWATWKKTTFYEKIQMRKAQQKREAGRKGLASSPPVCSLTSEMDSTIGSGDKDEVLKQLMHEQEMDAELSPLDDDLPGSRPRKVRSRKRL